MPLDCATDPPSRPARDAHQEHKGGRLVVLASSAPIVRGVDLPVLPLMPRCPAAAPIVGVSAAMQGVTCRVMQRSHVEDAGLNMTAAASGFIQHEADGGVYLNLKSDPATVTQFCHGDAVPVLGDDDVPGGRASYTYCPTWQAERERIWDGREDLLSDPEPEPVAMGMSSTDAVDPWQSAREGLELFGEEA